MSQAALALQGPGADSQAGIHKRHLSPLGRLSGYHPTLTAPEQLVAMASFLVLLKAPASLSGGRQGSGRSNLTQM